ncbi:AAA family ATPase [Akkermansia muciniphila]|uniref:AAA family ATPase n=1 Tax=Akkermansia muciniphila TaxID=239935 RepID=A0A2N8HF05_9BACT|nr:zeta toxin family protein [Akkermansia muciniphila]PNC18858.1 AAA family ATPase [Akkermansia muciniphila]
MPVQPRLLILAGPNGSGKSTLTKALAKHEWGKGCRSINADEMAQELGSWNDPECVKQAQSKTVDTLNKAIEDGEDIIYETVFSHPSKIELIWKAKQKGYFIRFFFVGTRSPLINCKRVLKRVASKGHKVPREKILGRYTRSYVNSVMAMRLADRGYLYDNSEEKTPDCKCPLKLLLRTEKGGVKKEHGKENWNPIYSYFLGTFCENQVYCWNRFPLSILPRGTQGNMPQ